MDSQPLFHGKTPLRGGKPGLGLQEWDGNQQDWECWEKRDSRGGSRGIFPKKEERFPQNIPKAGGTSLKEEEFPWDAHGMAKLRGAKDAAVPGEHPMGNALWDRFLPGMPLDRAVALLYLLLGLSFVFLMALSIVNLRRVSMAWEALEEARMRDESGHTTAWLNLSQVQHALDKQLSKEVNAVRIQLLNVSREVEKMQGRMLQCEVGCGKELLGRLQDLEAGNALEPVLRRLEGLDRELSVVLEETRGLSRILCPTCPAGWLQFARTCYFFSSGTKTWEEAKEFCRDHNGHLAIVGSEQENKFLANHIMDTRVFWLGLTDSMREGHWEWQDGSSLSLSFWNSGEPNNVGQHGEDCATILPNGHWNDVVCSNKEAWICERSC